MPRATRFRHLVQQRHWTVYETFSLYFQRAAKELAKHESDPQLATVNVSRRSFDRWMAGDLKRMPWPSTCRILEHLFQEPAAKLFDVACSPPEATTAISAADPEPHEESTTNGGGKSKSTTRSGIALPAAPSTLIEAHDRISPYLTAMDSFRRADRQLGGGHVYRSVLHYLQHTVAPRLFGDATGQDGGEVFRAAAVLTEMAGWMAHDSGRDSLAREHFSRALQFARILPDGSVAANIFGAMSHLALQCHRLEDAAALARAGQDHIKASARVPMLSSRLHAMEARAQARLGNASGAQCALAAARNELDLIPDERTPRWVAPFDGAALASEVALVLKDLGMLTAAATEADRAVTLRGADRARSRAFGQISLADILISQGELERACAVGHEVVGACQTLGSLRITQQLNDLRHALSPYSSVRTVSDLLDHLAMADQHRGFLLASLALASTERSPADEAT